MAEPLQGEIFRWPDVPNNHPMRDKVRRWVVVSRDVFNKHHGHVLACPLTSYPATELDIQVRATPHNSLAHDSALLPRMITPIRNVELGQPCGRLPAADVGRVLDLLTKILGV